MFQTNPRLRDGRLTRALTPKSMLFSIFIQNHKNISALTPDSDSTLKVKDNVVTIRGRVGGRQHGEIRWTNDGQTGHQRAV
jgi:hypothetical protein